MGRKCNVLDCPSDSRRVEDNGVTFHKMPFHPDLRPKWIELCRIPEERQTNKVIYVCSRHFRRTDFCNFKGTKYMLKQGALPSVFPWTKHLIKSVDRSISASPKDYLCITNVDIKNEPVDDAEQSIEEDSMLIEKNETSEECLISSNDMFLEIKNESSSTGNTMSINFLSGTKIEANDFNDKWYTAIILEVDYEENEVFVEFDKHLNRANEWIPMDSSRLRPYAPRMDSETYSVGERCLAAWVDTSNKFPATVRRVLEGDSYEVLFDDGFVKILKYHKLSKMKNTEKANIHIAPLFDPVIGSKEDRRERKRKINVAELFGIHKKKQKDDYSYKNTDIQEEEKTSLHDSLNTSTFAQNEGEEWTCRWLNGEPVGIESLLDNAEGSRRSIIVPDHRLPAGWEKHLTQRIYGTSAGKWDTVLVNPEGKKFHSRQAVKQWLEENKLDFHIDRFDFCLHLNRARKLGLYEITNTEPSVQTIFKTGSTKATSGPKSKNLSKMQNKLSGSKSGSSVSVDIIEEHNDNTGGLKIVMENDSYKCPIEGCGKNFRKENLAHMHIKHYHPEYTKFIGSTPNVADLAYARTVGEHIDDIVPKQKPINVAVEKEKIVKTEISPKQRPVLKLLPSKEVQNKNEDIDSKITESINASEEEIVYTPVVKDSEIIRILNSEPKTKIAEQELQTVRKTEKDCTDETTSHDTIQNNEIITSVKYPDIKLTDLLKKAEPVPTKKSDHRTGIKTLLPVIRSVQEMMVQESEIDTDRIITNSVSKFFGKSKHFNKRQFSENDVYKDGRMALKCEADDLSDYYEGDSKSRDSFNNRTTELTTVLHEEESPQIIIEGGEVIRLVHMRSEEIINCTCGITEEDGLMIQCELCLCWQHAHCNNIEKENQVPEKYVCKICKNPQRMRASMKYIHDQEWLKHGLLATANYHARNEKAINEKFEKLRKAHELSGCLIELKEYMHNLRIKLNIAEVKNHPKLYLWAKIWNSSRVFPNFVNSESKRSSRFKENTNIDIKSVINTKNNNGDNIKIQSQSELISILEDNEMETGVLNVKEEETEIPRNNLGFVSDKNTNNELSEVPCTDLTTSSHYTVPQPEAPINSTDCRMHLLDHIFYFQNLVEQRLNYIETDLKGLEEFNFTTTPDETSDKCSQTKQTLQMLIRDVTNLQSIAVLNN